MKILLRKIDCFIEWLDRLPLWPLFLLVLSVNFAPILILGEGSVFDYHDQMDESMMNIVLSARHLGEGLEVFPEMMGG